MSNNVSGTAVGFLVLLAFVVIGGGAFGCPHYTVWSKEMAGKAQLSEARQNRQIRIEEAQANLEAEKLNALSEVERAKGMAEAMEIEGGALTTEYIHYLWVRQNNFSKSTTIYIPTEAGLPILEASRFSARATQSAVNQAQQGVADAIGVAK